MANRLEAPKSGVTVRMYRQGHGDCYLFAFPRKDKRNKDPYYVLIDCGYKGGSQKHPKKGEAVLPNVDFKNIADSIFEATNGRIDLFVITHEHEDHVNGIKEKYFDRFHIEEAWFSWTEDPDDELAKGLVAQRKKAISQLLGARMKLALAIGEENDSVEKLDNFIGLELGNEDEGFNAPSALAAAGGKKVSANRRSMNLVRGKATENKGVTYWKPGAIAEMKETEDIQAYVLGPPRSKRALKDLNPKEDEAFEDHSNARHFAFSSALTSEKIASPFDSKFGLHCENIFKEATIKKNAALEFYSKHYGNQKTTLVDGAPVADNADWRRIDESWLYSADNLAIKLNNATNNTSLVLAFELPKTKKVLLFIGDAQRGSWVSWTDNTWKDAENQSITAKDILNRTVLYKVGHHGSHNATLDGTDDSPHANLSWMGKEKYGKEFTAMINAVEEWAWNKSHKWKHPLPSIKDALLKKTQGRVFQTDTGELEKPDGVSDATWQKFLKKSTFNDLYFDYTVLDEFE